MKPSDAPTVKAKRAPIILVVGLDAPLVRRCSDAAAKHSANVVSVEAGAESSFAMQALPIAVVMHETAVATSALGTVAHELGIELIKIGDEQLTDERIEAMIADAVTAGRARFRAAVKP